MVAATPLLCEDGNHGTISVMADKIIGSLIYDDHPIPKKSRAWKERLKVPVAIGLVLFVIGGIVWKFANYREEGRVRQFIESLQNGQYEAAYGIWDSDGHYRMEDFLQDWGRDGFYTKGMNEARVVDSNSRGNSVIVYLGIDNLRPIALMVDKETLRLSFSPTNKYSQ
jgi:hypothetical protein